ncbi:LPXTG cell wall anchor domain-containing protein, partial [Streptomyces sp. ADI92-24]|uniref:LPXTG cell wall anchor domain-containing protein n=2 Tax=unclassified Streptomyces TaxID=2593676 RepID=UPI0013DD9F05
AGGGDAAAGGGDATGGGDAATGGSGSGTDGGNAGTCTVDLDGAECADNTDTDSVGNQPAEQGKGKDELAETGAAETTFLLVGAATMIAGGIGFRILPRLMNGRTAA